MKRLLLILALCGAPQGAWAQASGFKPLSRGERQAAADLGAERYERPRLVQNVWTGERFTVTPHVNGSASVRGFNAQPGGAWTGVIDSRGDFRWRDGAGRLWTRDSRTGALCVDRPACP